MSMDGFYPYPMSLPGSEGPPLQAIAPVSPTPPPGLPLVPAAMAVDSSNDLAANTNIQINLESSEAATIAMLSHRLEQVMRVVEQQQHQLQQQQQQLSEDWRGRNPIIVSPQPVRAGLIDIFPPASDPPTPPIVTPVFDSLPTAPIATGSAVSPSPSRQDPVFFTPERPAGESTPTHATFGSQPQILDHYVSNPFSRVDLAAAAMPSW